MLDIASKPPMGIGESLSTAVAMPPYRPAHSSLSEIELSVVRLSRMDPPSSLEQRHAWRSRIACLLGAETHNALADPRLEALRRYAVAERLRRWDGASLNEMLLTAGLSADQASEVVQMVAPWRAPPSRGSHWPVWLLLGVVGAITYVTTFEALGDPLIALMLMGLALILTATVVLPKIPQR